MKNAAIKENHLFSKAYRKGLRFSGKYIYVYVLRDLMAKKIMLADPMKKYTNRLGIAVSKKNNGGAVERNRAKRIIRAAYYSERDKIMTGFLIVISAKPAIAGIKSTELLRELDFAFDKLGLKKQTQNQTKN